MRSLQFLPFLALFAAGCIAEPTAPEGQEPVGATEQAWDSQDGNPTHATHSYLTEFAIEPSDLTLPAGGGVVTITNAGTVDHNLSVDGQTSEMIPAGGTAELDLTGLADGSYEMTCQVAGHADAGMKGTLTVG